MALVGIDPERTRTLASTMGIAADDLDDLRAEVDQTLSLAQLDSTVPFRLAAEATELDKVSVVLIARADLAQGLEIDIERLAEQLDVSSEQVADAVTALTNPDLDASGASPLLSLVGASHYLFDGLPESSRDVFVGLPAVGQDPELDAAIGRLDSILLPAILNGQGIDPDDLTKQQRADLKLVASALGGDDFTIRRTRTEKYAGAGGDDEYRKVTEDVAITSLGPETILRFVELSLEDGAELRQASNEMRRVVGDGLSSEDAAAVSVALGVTEEQAGLIIEGSIILASFDAGSAGDAGADAAADAVDTAARSGVDLEQFRENRDRLREISDELSDVEFQDDVLSVGNAGVNLAAAALTAAAFFVSLPASIGAALVVGTFYTWGRSSYVDTRLEELKKEQEELEQQQQDARDNFNHHQDRRDNLAKDGIDPGVRDDDFSGDQNTGPGGIL